MLKTILNTFSHQLISLLRAHTHAHTHLTKESPSKRFAASVAQNSLLAMDIQPVTLNP
ncbi:hypothetical protein X777_15885 [Ooceraea biroi]|uniref:Uncharacterized protein n=1 Tax=Ooceraea biroi TaxID=2015173 RepID=A0A026WTA3_OOCBI|nr:hypothetical protein X777_15885 [Ooceraea biroi]